MGLVIVIEFIFAGIRGVRLKALKKWDKKVFFRQEFCGPFGGWSVDILMIILWQFYLLLNVIYVSGLLM